MTLTSEDTGEVLTSEDTGEVLDSEQTLTPVNNSGVTAHVIMDLAQSVLTDTYTFWTEPTMLDALCDGQTEICNINPSAYSITSTMKLGAGSRQYLPTLTKYMQQVVATVSGTVLGPAPNVLTSNTMDNLMPAWRSYAASPTVMIVVYDATNPKEFSVFPPQPAADQGSLMVNCCMVPARITDSSQFISVTQEYHPALLDYILYRCYEKEDDPGSQARSQAHFAAFTAKVSGLIPVKHQ